MPPFQYSQFIQFIQFIQSIIVSISYLIRQYAFKYAFKHILNMGLILTLFSGALTPCFAGILDDNEARKAILELRAEVRQRDADQTDRLNHVGAASADSILALRQEQTSATKRLIADVDALKRTLLDLNNALTQLKEQNAQLSGQLELLNNTQQQQSLALNTATTEAQTQRKKQTEQIESINSLEIRLKQLEPRKVAVDGQEALIDKSEETQFNAALAAFKAGNYDAATRGLTAFITQYPQSALLGTAYFWLGNSQYANHALKDAATTLQWLLQKFPQHPRVSDGALTLAQSYAELGDVAQSQSTYQWIITHFPNTAAAQTAQQALIKPNTKITKIKKLKN